MTNNASDAIHTPADLLAAIGDLRNTAGQVQELGSGASPAKGLLGPRGGNGQNIVAAKVAEAFAETERMGFEVKRKEKLQSAILHLVAEVLLGSERDGAVVAAYTSRIDDFRHGLKMQHSDYLKQFVNVESLRESLR